jgi:hypothetical protein
MKGDLVFPYPGGKLLLNNFPDTIFPLHSQNDAVSPVVTDVNGELTLGQTIRFSKIELPQAAIGLDQLGELNIPDELYLHKAPFEKKVNEQNLCYIPGGFLKNSEFCERRIG